MQTNVNEFRTFDFNVELSDAVLDFIATELDLAKEFPSEIAKQGGVFSRMNSYRGLAGQTLDVFGDLSLKGIGKMAASQFDPLGLGGLAFSAFFPNPPAPEIVKGMGPIAQLGHPIADLVTAKVMDQHIENIQRSKGRDAVFVDGELVTISESKLPGTDITLRSITGNADITVEQVERAQAVNIDNVHPETKQATLAEVSSGFIDTATGNFVSRSGDIFSYGPEGAMRELEISNPAAYAQAMESRKTGSLSRVFDNIVDAFFGSTPTPKDVIVEDPLAIGPESRPSQGAGPTYETRSVPATDARGRGIMSGRPGVQVISGMVETVRKDPDPAPAPVDTSPNDPSIPDDIEGATELDFGYEASDMAADDPATDEAEV
tara:strand:- start:48 stop:1175 length:1128 start_codon:yes stop_codon:yes gene_type:complete